MRFNYQFSTFSIARWNVAGNVVFQAKRHANILILSVFNIVLCRQDIFRTRVNLMEPAAMYKVKQ